MSKFIGSVFKRKNFNDSLALLFGAGIPGLWLLNHWYPLPSEAIGASIVVWTLVAQFYFRRAPASGDSSPGG